MLFLDPSKQASYKPATVEAANAKALINSLMQDRFFLALYRSDDPKERANAMDKLNKAHHRLTATPRHHTTMQPRTT